MALKLWKYLTGARPLAPDVFNRNMQQIEDAINGIPDVPLAPGGTLYNLKDGTGDHSIVQIDGDDSNVASGEASIALGEANQATEVYAFAEGARNVSSGYASHAEGADNISSNSSTHAEGANTEASGEYSHSEGNATIAS
jgi:uncharacterized protein YjbJ (UPF0337 family)